MGKAWTALVPVLALVVAACGGRPGGAAVRSAGRPGVLVGIAASDGVGIGANNPDRDNWIAQLGGRLPAGTKVINLGISGATAARATEQELPVAVDAHAGVVAVWLGVNDYEQRVPLAAFIVSLQQIVSELRTDSHTRVFVGNLPDLRLLGAFSGRDPAVLDIDTRSWNAEIARVTGEAGASLVDIYGAWTSLKEHIALISNDGLHPTTAGYQRIAELFWQSIRETS